MYLSINLPYLSITIYIYFILIYNYITLLPYIYIYLFEEALGSSSKGMTVRAPRPYIYLFISIYNLHPSTSTYKYLSFFGGFGV